MFLAPLIGIAGAAAGAAGGMAGILSGVGGILSAGMSIFGGIQQSQMANYNAAIARQQAIQAKQVGELEAKRAGYASEKRIGAAVAEVGGSGVSVEGSPLELITDIATQGALDQQIARYRGKVSAAEYNAQASQYKVQGRQALIGGIGKGLTTLLSAGTDFFGGSYKSGDAGTALSTAPRSVGGAGVY